MNREQIEEYAFYESGLSADGCLDKLDDYAKSAIQRYGRLLIEKQTEISRKLYSVALQLQEVSKTNMVVVVGPNFYSELVDAIKMYEEYNSIS